MTIIMVNTPDRCIAALAAYSDVIRRQRAIERDVADAERRAKDEGATDQELVRTATRARA